MVLSTTQQKNTQIKSLLIGTLRSLLYTQVSVDIGILYAKLLSTLLPPHLYTMELLYGGHEHKVTRYPGK